MTIYLVVESPQSSSSLPFRIQLESGNIRHYEKKKSGIYRESFSEQGPWPTTDYDHIWCRRRVLNPGHHC